jgi:hypothetical protein
VGLLDNTMVIFGENLYIVNSLLIATELHGLPSSVRNSHGTDGFVPVHRITSSN